jgi:L-iditol 2-dehydrogenase
VRAALTVAPHETRVEEVPDPACGPGDVVCRVLACATCRSDVGTNGLPAVLGHEPAGEIVTVGRDVRSVAVGDQVAIQHRAPCGECPRCHSGHETLCRHATVLDPGGFAEYVRIPAPLVGELLPLDGLDPVVATLTEPLASALRAQDRVALDAVDALLIVGAGASGLLQIAGARSRGVETILVREPDLARRARAERWGARAYAGEPVDVAIVCTPAPRALADAAEALDAGGRLCLYATAAPGTPTGVDAWTLLSRELTITASWAAGRRHMRAALALLRTGAVPAGELLSARFSLACTGDALAAQRSGAALKAVVLPWA